MTFRALLVFATASVLFAAGEPADCRLLDKRGKSAEARACFENLLKSRRAFHRAEGLFGLRQYAAAHEQFKIAIKEEPKNAELRTRWGRLLADPFNGNKADAADLYQEALEIDAKYAPAMLGLALLASDRFDSMATSTAKKALETDPKLYEAQELLASLALEDSDFKRAAEEADKAIKMSPDALDAMAIQATLAELADRPSKEWFDKIFAVNPRYGRAHAIVAHHLVLNRRYDEGIAHYRKAIALDPGDLDAHAQLGINLMRQGKEGEARQELEFAFNSGVRADSTKNTLRLMDSYKNFKIFETSNTILKLDKKEADLLRIYFEDELRQCIAAFETKYKLKLSVPVQLEVFPNHEDFAVRTMGMPGLGALGVTFGTVVAMDSPSGRKPGAFHWASTLWHEMSHVFVLVATKHRVPRWFTEGVAVHEETATHKDWGDRLTPDMIAAVKGKKLLKVAELDRGFIRPTYPNQVIVSYFQGGRIIDYIVEKWGWNKVLAMMHGYGARKSTEEVFKEVLGVPADEFDTQFLAWLDKSIKPVVDNFDDWRKKIRELANAAKAKDHAKVLADGDAVIALYPDYVEAANAYEMVADAALASNDKKRAAAVLARYAEAGGREPDVLARLAGMQEEAGDTAGALSTYQKLLWVYPINGEKVHKKMGELALATGKQQLAIREFHALAADKPTDKADALYNLARAYWSARNRDKAEEYVLESLESAPGFRPAQKLLLELNSQSTQAPIKKK